MFHAYIPTNIISITRWSNLFRFRNYFIKDLRPAIPSLVYLISRVGSAAQTRHYEKK
jgi:F0F1-type ATP synthase alpha subunit